MSLISGYSWGFNAYGTSGVGTSSYDTDDKNNQVTGQEKAVLSPTPFYLPEDEDLSSLERDSDSSRRVEPGNFTKRGKDDNRKITKDQLWELWASRGEGGGFVSNGTYMVYGEQVRLGTRRPKVTRSEAMITHLDPPGY